MADKNSGWACTHGTEIIGSDNLGVTIRVTCYWKNQGWRYDMNGVSAWVYCAGQEVCVKSSSAIDTTGNNQAAYPMGSHDFYISRTHASQSISCYAKITSTSSYVSGTKSSGASSVGVDAKPSYAVTYNLNGGSGSFGNQTKWYNEELTLHSATPTRTGHNFVRWNTNTANTGTGYAPGGKYNGNGGLTLYAIWTPQTHTVSFNANGGTGAPASQTKVYGTVLKLSSTIPTRTNYNFKGWATSANGSVVYAAGGDYGTDVDVTLYAVWELAYVKPRITNFTANRSTSDGTASETGTYIRVSFSWATDKNVSAIQVQYREQTSSTWLGGALTYTGTKSGTVTQAVGQGNISAEKSYHVRVYVSDGSGDAYTTYSAILSIGTTKFPIDVKAGGKGVAIGKVAETENLFDVDFNSTFRNNVSVVGNLNINATMQGGNVPIGGTIDNNGNFDDVGSGGQLNKNFIGTILAGGTWYDIINIRHRNGGGDGVSHGMQFRKNLTSLTAALETRSNGTGYWSNWDQISRYRVLFDNSSGTTGTITLNEDSSKFAYLEIFYSHDTSSFGYKSTRIQSPNGKRATLDLVEGQGPYMATYVAHVAISGTSVSFARGNGMSIYGVNFTLAGFVQVNEIKIYKVIGWR